MFRGYLEKTVMLGELTFKKRISKWQVAKEFTGNENPRDVFKNG
ncbi:hypothetical protein SBF1_2280003 [Candidatus Desulfosporosinus infrequens]|uniref:Uncharacterized protein n=1 Tax=Candidatus Desulfosporosinus infrequens TaxID=2043169 RepID=A0A2U3KLM4_9FIRM|nr:hypothetical protein SBF1_2280003 [Candidatus Desulfosporosinus infrequens]